MSQDMMDVLIELHIVQTTKDYVSLHLPLVAPKVSIYLYVNVFVATQAAHPMCY